MNRFYENLRKNVLYSGSSNNSFSRLSVSSFNHFNKEFNILRHQSQNKYSLRLLILYGLNSAVLSEFILFGLDEVDYILPNDRQFMSDVVNKHHIHGLYQRLYPHLVSYMRVLFMLPEKLRLFSELFFDCESTLCWSQIDTGVAEQ